MDSDEEEKENKKIFRKYKNMPKSKLRSLKNCIGFESFQKIYKDKTIFKKTYLSLPEMKDLIKKLSVILNWQKKINVVKKIVTSDGWYQNDYYTSNFHLKYLEKIHIANSGGNNVLFNGEFLIKESAGLTIQLKFYILFYYQPIACLHNKEIRNYSLEDEMKVDIIMDVNMLTRYKEKVFAYNYEDVFIHSPKWESKNIKVYSCKFKNLDKFIEEIERCESAGIKFTLPPYFKNWKKR
jgi:hypothetical protein